MIFTITILWVAALHPFILYPLSLLIVKKLSKSQNNKTISNYEKTPHSFSVCFSAFNEADIIDKKINNLLEIQEKSENIVDILVYVDGCKDDTLKILENFNNKITIVNSSENTGKSFGLNQLMKKVKTDITIFTDANVMFELDSVDRMSAHFHDPLAGCVMGKLVYTNNDSSATAKVSGIYWRFEEWLKQLETNTGSTMGADGSIFAIRTKLFKPLDKTTIPDMGISFEALFQNYRILTAPDVLAYELNATEVKEEFTRKVRISCRAFNWNRRMWGKITKLSSWNLYKYISHKLLRWFAIYFLVASILTTLLFWFGFVGGSILSAALFAIIWLGSRYKIKIISSISNIFLAFLATGIGVYYSIRGKTYQTWISAKSSRS